MSEKTFSPRPVPAFQRKFSLKFWFSRIGIFLGSILITSGILFFEFSERVGGTEFVIGEPSPRALFSPMEFSYENKEATQAKKDQAVSEVSLAFSLNSKVKADALEKSESLFHKLNEMALSAQSQVEGIPQIDTKKLPVEISRIAVQSLLKEKSVIEAEQWLRTLIETYLSKGIFKDEDKQMFLRDEGKTLSIHTADSPRESILNPRDVLSISEVASDFERQMAPEIQKSKALKLFLSEALKIFIKPNLVYDESESKSRRKKVLDLVAPVEEKIKKNELIVQRGMRILPQEKIRIDQIQKKLAEHKILNQLFTTLALVVIAFVLCFLYFLFYGPEMLRSLRMTLLSMSIILTSVFLSKLIAIWPGSSYYLMPTAIAPILFVLLTETRFGFLSAVMMTLFSAVISDFSPEVILGTLFSGFIATFASFRVRKRLEFLRVGFFTGIAYFVVLFAVRTFHEYPIDESIQISILGLANGFMIATPICFILLPIFEWVFNLTTDITLLELSDLNHPLLKRMIIEAPGTYHHSLVVSTLAESACEAIGANALLARVGCYFHDIGKIARAEFFTENIKNQTDSKHLKLTPTMSCLIIMNHVKEGIELGRKYKLKERILKFIPEHQGTGVIYYFYRKALDYAKQDEKINPDDFRYPGPKPQSKETAVALLADSTEAASRSLKEPTAESIRQLVRKIINDKFIDGQLDECDLSLRDLYKIQESFIHNLMAIFHTRVAYPANTEPGAERPDLFREYPLPKSV